ncbi:aldehyde dehydrogenase [Pokkaliibacter plantistimulans]|uniref:Aldehyde dehydrogenase n=1 Tax=Pokkaliibacter plantistimulans TaxID=1635171 RepID=A0ABX5M6T9_9GAMM|nr:molybdopterin cofactor-binding domain-containing protein [Pokkaliibacter plantistimulans]PXF32610.1 aldehyde dehydrogenase [Pokkaliibacter plantistimulans]
MSAINSPALDRRQFLKLGGMLGGGLIVGLQLPAQVLAAQPEASLTDLGAFIRIGHDNQVTLVMPMAEVGQGVYMAQSMLLAEELEVDVDTVKVLASPANAALYGNPAIGGYQVTGGSTTIRAFWTPLRQAGAVARTLLIAAAAQVWKVDPASCKASSGYVYDASGQRKLSYGELVDVAAGLPQPAADSVVLKTREQMTLLGKPHHRIDTPDKVRGKAQYGIDFQTANLKHAAIAVCPVLGGKPVAVDEAAIKAVRGVQQVVLTDEAVAVVADNTWAAMKGLRAASIQWDFGDNASVGMEEVVQQLDSESQQSGGLARNDGDVEKALASATTRLEAVYQLPFLSHAPMEPMNYTVEITDKRCDVWGGCQTLTLAQATVAQLTGLPPESVFINNFLMGGAFGRRLELDGMIHAVKVAKQVQGPVKVIWSREEDIQHGFYRPYYYDRLWGGLDAEGKPVAWFHRVSGSSIMARAFPGAFVNGVDPDGVEGAKEPPYEFDNIRVEFRRVEPRGVLTSWWRGVGPTHNVFMVESFIDEMAAAAKQDPASYRLALLGNNPRARQVLELALKQAGWGKQLPERHGLGVSVQFAFGSYLAMVAEVAVSEQGAVRCQRIHAVIDCGLTVNPDTVKAQIEGGAVFGLTAALYGAITVKDGQVQQSNFDTYQPVRMYEAPLVDVHIVDSLEAPGGVGETGTAAVFPAITNAVFAATGKRIRTLPINPSELKV